MQLTVTVGYKNGSVNKEVYHTLNEIQVVNMAPPAFFEKFKKNASSTGSGFLQTLRTNQFKKNRLYTINRVSAIKTKYGKKYVVDLNDKYNFFLSQRMTKDPAPMGKPMGKPSAATGCTIR